MRQLDKNFQRIALTEGAPGRWCVPADSYIGALGFLICPGSLFITS
jgi:hypothetical protein